jgi:undecaprenyl-diphosphatase
VAWWQAVLLGVIQGVTEFLPVSSSGHLVLAQHFLGFPGESEAHGAALFFDGILHLGTLVAVLLYFRQGLRQQVTQHFRQGDHTERVWPATFPELCHLGVLVALATLPAVVATVGLKDHIEWSFTDHLFVASNLLILGLILLVTDRIPQGNTTGPQTAWWQALLIGIAQALAAVFRGLSRSGMTISAALGVGLQRDWAVRFSFMMSVVANLGLGGLALLKALRDPEAGQWLTPEFLALTLLGTTVSAVVGYLTIDPLIRLVRRCRLWWFSLYLWLVGGSVLLAHFLKPS